jgi:hypothetical protein
MPLTTTVAQACACWAEIDMQRIVFNAHYLTYFDTAITDYWRALALPYDDAMHTLGGEPYLKKVTRIPRLCSRRRHADDRHALLRVGNSSMLFEAAFAASNCWCRASWFTSCRPREPAADPGACEAARTVCRIRGRREHDAGSAGVWQDLGDRAARAPGCIYRRTRHCARD